MNAPDEYCLACGAPLLAEGACQSCGTNPDQGRYQALQAAARPAFLYGYRYRRLYEQSKELHLHLTWDSLWSFVAIAVASGVIGNASWEAVKAVVSRAIESHRARTEAKNTAADALLDAAELEVAMAYFREYLAGGACIPPEVYAEIQKEQAATELAPIVYGAAHGATQFDSIADAEAVVESVLQIPLRTEPQDFAGLWDQVEIKR